MHRRPTQGVRASRAALAAVTAIAVLMWALASGTLGGWTSALVTNDTDTTTSGTLSIQHSYNSTTCTGGPSATTPSCAGSLYPAATSAAGATRADDVTNTGTVPAASLDARARIAGCGAVQLANAVSGSGNGAMLPRTGTTFNPTSGPAAGFGSVTLDGRTGYASSVGASTEPGGLVGRTYGLGIWFRTTSTSTGALFGLGTNPLDTAGASNDRILYLDGAGRIAYIAGNGAGNLVTISNSAGTPYNDGRWHFAYVGLSVAAGLVTTVTIVVDGVQAASGTVVGLASYAGFWHLGWSPVGGTGRYFAGSLSGFVVDDSGSAPAATSVTSNPTSYSFDSATRTALWQLDDSGGAFDGTTVSGVLPASTALPTSAATPCSAVDVAWALTSPAATVFASGTTMSAAVTAGWTTLTARPAPGSVQTSSITLKRNATYTGYLTGLIVYAPIQFEYSTGGTWITLFTWANPAPNTAAGSTTVLA